MTFHELAYGPDEHVLLTVDGGELLAHDAQTEAPKWRLTLAHPLVAVLFAEAGALPGSGGPNPWRSSAGRSVIAVDADGCMHAIDSALGQETGQLGPFGKPVSVAAGEGGSIALATGEKVCLWRGGERTDIPSVDLHRLHGGAAGSWTPETAMAGLAVRDLWVGGGTIWGRAVGSEGVDGVDDRLLQRSASGRWTEKMWYGAKRPSTVDIHAVWVSPTGDAFVAADTGVVRSRNGGAS